MVFFHTLPRPIPYGYLRSVKEHPTAAPAGSVARGPAATCRVALECHSPSAAQRAADTTGKSYRRAPNKPGWTTRRGRCVASGGQSAARDPRH